MSVVLKSGVVVRDVPVSSSVAFGNHLPLGIMAGPCSIESRDIALQIADTMVSECGKLGIPYVFKASFDKANRTSIHGVRGIGWEAARAIFLEIKAKYACPIITDVHTPEQCEAVAEVADILQIPAFLCRQTDLIVAAAKTGKTLNIKKGQFLSPEEMHTVVEKAVSVGNSNIMMCERGTTFGYHLLVNDMRGLAIMGKNGYPVIFDATHSVQRPGGKGNSSGGDRECIELLARAATAVGIAGLFLETHPNPDSAPSDGPNMVPLADVGKMLAALSEIDRVTKSLSYQDFSLSALPHYS
ncbi:MAG: 3-deoxy-8-phosphooctulonate synthase [Alphaproteobacteria bacterium]|nr:3-deoxy-8-phosphooctulonate synthase [Alphaproteobacteria bacterium]